MEKIQERVGSLPERNQDRPHPTGWNDVVLEHNKMPAAFTNN